MAASSVTTLAKYELTHQEQRTLEHIFTVARAHSSLCESTFLAVHDAIEETPTAPEATDFLEEYVATLEKVFAAIAPAALARVSMLAPIAGDGIVALLNGDHREDAEAFIRPIFEEAGIAEDFKP